MTIEDLQVALNNMTPDDMHMTLELVSGMEDVTDAGNQYTAATLTEAEIDMNARAYLAGDRSDFAVISAYWTAAMNEIEGEARHASGEYWNAAVAQQSLGYTPARQAVMDKASATWDTNNKRRADLAEATGLGRIRQSTQVGLK